MALARSNIHWRRLCLWGKPYKNQLGSDRSTLHCVGIYQQQLINYYYLLIILSFNFNFFDAFLFDLLQKHNRRIIKKIFINICFRKANPLNVIIKVGAILFPDHFSVTYKVSHIINHPEYAKINNDITLVRLAKPVQITNFVKPICLPNGILDSDIEKSYKYCILTGFGFIDKGILFIT